MWASSCRREQVLALERAAGVALERTAGWSPDARTLGLILLSLADVMGHFGRRAEVFTQRLQRARARSTLKSAQQMKASQKSTNIRLSFAGSSSQLAFLGDVAGQAHACVCSCLVPLQSLLLSLNLNMRIAAAIAVGCVCSLLLFWHRHPPSGGGGNKIVSIWRRPPCCGCF